MVRLRLPLLVIVCLAFCSIGFGQVVYTMFPQIAVGGTWSCDFVINNQSFEPVYGLQLSLYGDSGAPLTVNSDLGTRSVFSFDLTGGETKTIRISSSGGVQAGYAVLRRPYPSAVSATLVVRYKSGSTVQTQLGVPHQEAHTSFSFAGEVNLAQGVSTGIAIAYPTYAGSNPLTVVITLIQPDSSVYGQATMTLQPGEHKQGFLNDPNLFPGLSTFSGTVNASAGRRFGIIAMRLEGLALGTVSINRGAVLTLGKCSAPSSAETEPNDSRALAQPLVPPALVNGVINASGGKDYFSVSAQKDQVLTIMAETQGMDSWADTEVSVEDNSGVELAWNDQNGLYAQNDSFLQFVIPATGTYYIQVTDYWGDGGADYTYKLHVSLGSNGPATQTPVIQTVMPSSGTAGTSVDVIIVGENLNGATAVNISPSTGITATVVVATPTTVVATLTIASGAAPGARQLSVTTPQGTSNAVTFTVSGGSGAAPVIDLVSPSSGLPGSTVYITVVGANLSGATSVNFSPSTGISVSDIQSMASFVSATLTIASGAATGDRQMTVTTPQGTSNALTFTVSSGGANAPTINNLLPSVWPAGKSVDITINGTNLSGVTAVNLSPSDGISVSGIQSTSYSVTATLTITSGAATGNRQLTVTTAGGTSNSVTFRVASSSTTGYNGVWTGTTGQGKPLTFLIEGDYLRYVKFAATISGSGCTANVTSQTSFSNMPLAGSVIGFSTTGGPGGTSLDVTGSFTSTTSASGTADITLHSIPGVPSCSGSATTSWSATKN